MTTHPSRSATSPAPAPTSGGLCNAEWTRCSAALSASFFFSSRRRHTRCSPDWSSDVCSSDLGMVRTTRGAAIQESELPAVYAPPGRQTYKDYCAACHGSEGKGHGPVCPLSAKGSAGPHHSREDRKSVV